MRIVVCGDKTPWPRGRARARMRSFLLDNFPAGRHQVVTGSERPAEQLAAEVARDLGWSLVTMFADGARYVRHAEHVRNREMVETVPDVIVVFPGMYADDMRRVGRLAGVKTIDVG